MKPDKETMEQSSIMYNMTRTYGYRERLALHLYASGSTIKNVFYPYPKHRNATLKGCRDDAI